MLRALRVPLRALFLVFALALAGCPTPIPTCTAYKFARPGIDLRLPSMALEPVPEGYASVFGQFAVSGAGQEGAVSLRLISYKDLFDRSVYGEKEVRLPPDGRFQWILPVGHYSIQPIYFHHDYADHHYRSVKSVELSLGFDAPESKRSYFLGSIEVTVSPDFRLERLNISGEMPNDGAVLRQVGTESDRVEVSLMRQDSQSGYIAVPRRKICQNWNMPSWCVPVPYGRCFGVDDN